MKKKMTKKGEETEKTPNDVEKEIETKGELKLKED